VICISASAALFCGNRVVLHESSKYLCTCCKFQRPFFSWRVNFTEWDGIRHWRQRCLIHARNGALILLVQRLSHVTKNKGLQKKKHKAQLLGDELHNLTLKLGNIVIASGYPRTDVLFRLRILPWPKGGHPFFDTKKQTRKKETDIPQPLPYLRMNHRRRKSLRFVKLS
jgi:hypothetical protein